MMNNGNDLITVFIVAASAIARAGLESVLQSDERFVVSGSAAEISAAPSGFSVHQTADVLLINVEQEKDFDELLVLLGDSPEETNLAATVVLFPTEMQNSQHAVKALQNGGRGVLPIDASADEIVATVAAAATGLISFLPETLENLLSFSDANNTPDSLIENNRQVFPDEMIEPLTAREAEVLEMLIDGASNKSIAYQLNISEHTVKFHVASIFAKLGVNTRTEAVTLALRRGLILL